MPGVKPHGFFRSVTPKNEISMIDERYPEILDQEKSNTAPQSKQYRILIADDEEGIRMFICLLLERKGYEIVCVSDAKEALDALAEKPFDLLISDIRMPGMDGFELLKTVEQQYPSMKRILMTGYDIDNYIDMVRQFNVGNVLSKSEMINYDEWCEYIESILTEEIFGLDRLLPGTNIQCSLVRNHQESRDTCSKIVKEYQGDDRVYFEVSVNELITNAVYHGVLQVTNISREQWQEDYQLSAAEAVRVCWCSDSEKIGVSVEDPRGKLRKTDVLRWLDHRIDEPLGDQEHGRGFMLVRRFIDRFVINIDRGRKTECVIVQNFDKRTRNRHKPLLIHEI